MSRNMVEDRIIEAAQLEFAKKGFHKTVVSDIAFRAGVGKGTVYRHFGNKEDLFGTLIKLGTLELQEKIREALSRSDSAVQTMENILDLHFDFFDHSRELIEIIVIEGLQLTDSARKDLVKEFYHIRELFRTFFNGAIESGVFRKMDPDRLALLLQSFIWSVLRGAIIFEEENPRTRYKALMLEIFLEGVKKDRD